MPRRSLKSFCRSLPGVTEDMKWETNHVFSVGSKMFAVFHVDDEEQVSFKASTENFALLTRQPDIEPAPYLARAQWVLIKNLKALPREAVEDLLRESHQLVAEKLPLTVRRRLGLAEGEPANGVRARATRRRRTRLSRRA